MCRLLLRNCFLGWWIPSIAWAIVMGWSPPARADETASEPVPTRLSQISVSKWMISEPIPATIQFEKSKPLQAEIIRLAPEFVVYRAPGSRPALDRAASSKITRVEAGELNSVWQLSAETRLFAGPELSPRKRAVAFQYQQRKPSAEEELRYTFAAFRNGLNRAFRGVVSDPHDRDLDDFSLWTTIHAASLRGANDPRAQRLAKMCDEFPRVLLAIKTNVIAQRNAVDQYAKESFAIAEKRREAEAEADVQRMLGGMQMFVGGAPNHEEVLDSHGRVVDYADRGMSDEDLFYSGVSDWMNASKMEQVKKSALSAAARISDARRRRQIETAVNAQFAAMSAAREDLAKFARETFNRSLEMPSSNPTAVAAGDSGINSQPNAELDFLASDPLWLAFQMANRTPAGAARETVRDRLLRSREIVRLAERVPGGATFDIDRALILSLAGRVCLDAALGEIGRTSWALAFNQNADYARQMLDEALKLYPTDASAQIRERRAIALMISGQWHESISAIDSLVEMQPKTASIRFARARMLCADGDIDAGIKELEFAISTLGFDDLVAARAAGEFPTSHPMFRDLTNVEIDVSAGSVPIARPFFRLTNESKVRLRNISVRVNYVGLERVENGPRRGQWKEKQAKVEYFIPEFGPRAQIEMTYLAELPPKYDERGFPSGAVVIDAGKQGRFTTPLDQHWERLKQTPPPRSQPISNKGSARIGKR
jgi:tetratricopeptide (TPR) repeat protein